MKMAWHVCIENLRYLAKAALGYKRVIISGIFWVVCNVTRGHAPEFSAKVGIPYGPGKVAVLTRKTSLQLNCLNYLEYNKISCIMLHKICNNIYSWTSPNLFLFWSWLSEWTVETVRSLSCLPPIQPITIRNIVLPLPINCVMFWNIQSFFLLCTNKIWTSSCPGVMPKECQCLDDTGHYIFPYRPQVPHCCP